jgi:hypothetical protein
MDQHVDRGGGQTSWTNTVDQHGVPMFGQTRWTIVVGQYGVIICWTKYLGSILGEQHGGGDMTNRQEGYHGELTHQTKRWVNRVDKHGGQT